MMTMWQILTLNNGTQLLIQGGNMAGDPLTSSFCVCVSTADRYLKNGFLKNKQYKGVNILKVSIKSR